MFQLISRYTHWLHGQWPAGKAEPGPAIRADGSCALPGVYVVGDVSGVPLLKFALDTGAKAAQRCCTEITSLTSVQADYDVVIIGGGVAGMAAAVECARAKVRFAVIEAAQPFQTIANFPVGKPIFTYPTAMKPAGALQVGAGVREALLAELRDQTKDVDIPILEQRVDHVRSSAFAVEVVSSDGNKNITAKRAIIAIGRSGNFRRLHVPGEDSDLVSNRLHDPKSFADKRVLVVGGGDSACEAAVALADAGAKVVLAYRGETLSRPKPDNVAAVYQRAEAGGISLRLHCEPTAIADHQVTLHSGRSGSADEQVAVDHVLVLIGREAPLDFFRKSGIAIRGEAPWGRLAAYATFFMFAACLYGWKILGWFPAINPGHWVATAIESHPATTVIGTIVRSAASPSFWVTLLYSATVVRFGVARIRRRRTPYIRLQTSTLMAVQVLPLFFLPEIILPWLGANDLIPHGLREALFPGGSWWRAYGFVLAWPLMIWNVCTDQPYLWWLIIASVQTFVLIPLLVWRWGKGAYCGWICSCGGLAETLGDTHREKMPHGPLWNKLNMVGQVVLAMAFGLVALFILRWSGVSWAVDASTFMRNSVWKISIDYVLAGALGTGLYFAYSGRVWCRFACPLAALMHIYARFSRFRIVVESKKCISCNVCTSVCHQGIDIMNFANKGLHMEDPQCVRCSACVQSCPTGVLQFGRVDSDGVVVARDSLMASNVVARERDAKQD